MVVLSAVSEKPAIRRLVVLLAATGPTGELASALEAVTPILQKKAEKEKSVMRVGTRLSEDPFSAAAAATGRDIRSFDAFLQIEGAADEALLNVLDGMSTLIGQPLDARASSAALGDVYVLTPGSGDTLLALAACRRPDISPAQMHDYWLHTHAALALHLMPDSAPLQFGYNQLHVDASASPGAAHSIGVSPAAFDGLLQVWCDRPEDFLTVATEPAFAAQIFEDEKNFADQSRLQGAAFCTRGGAAEES